MITRVLILLAGLLTLGRQHVHADTLNFVAGTPLAIYTAAQRNALGLAYWPDGNLGVVAAGGNYGFYAANSGHSVFTTGTLANPGGAAQQVSITNTPTNYAYVAGGPVYDDPDSGRRLMFYHAEINNPTAQTFYSVLGMAVSTDSSKLTFRNLGPIVEASVTQSQAVNHAVDLGGASFVVNNGNFYVYFHDYNSNGTQNNTAVAEAPVTTVIANALAGTVTPFEKYYHGSFSQPGLNGLSSPLEVGNPTTNWMSVSYDNYLNEYLMVAAQTTGTNISLYLTSSADGLSWGPRQLLEGGSGELFYPSIVGIGANPQTAGGLFDVYYTSSQLGGFQRWSDAALMQVGVNVAIPGDANFDHVVNGLDIANVASHWLQSGNLIAGDVNNDGVVNGLDVAVIASHWLQATGSNSAAVPEPSGLGIVGSLLVANSLWVFFRHGRTPRDGTANR